MRRLSKFTEDEDSDQSISEEEELDSAVAENCISLGGSTEKKEELHVLSQLELLKDACELDHATKPTISSKKRQAASSCIQDAFDFPVCNNETDFAHFPRRSSTCNSDDEIISDDEKASLPTCRSTLKHDTFMESMSIRETELIIPLTENAGSSSLTLKAGRSSRGGLGRAKSKFSFHFHPHKEIPLAVNSKDETQLLSRVPSLQEDLEPIGNKAAGHSMSELLELLQGRKVEQSEIDTTPADVAVKHDHLKPSSVARLLVSIQENNVLLGGNSVTHGRATGQRAHHVAKRNMCSLGDRNVGEDESSEAFDSGSSSDEDDNKTVKCTKGVPKQKTMTDQFHQAFGISCMNKEGILFPFPRESGIGLFGRLQHIVQSEKERDLEFLRRLQTEASLTEGSSCIDVRILSRSLEAKLTVCCCSLIQDEERKELEKNSTVIFSPRTCNSVELEPGKLVRIHPPWKEIPIEGKEENIVLSTYFSQILT